ncbi:MAG TPA: hypothetical protein VIL78_10750 [Hanamia sp.]
MKLQINSGTQIEDVQKEFSKVYPFLRIDFFKKPHAENQLSQRKDKIDPKNKISEEGKFVKAESIDISKYLTVAELEMDFFNKFGIALQVSRKSGNIWIETSLTDDWTLEMQNNQGEELSTYNSVNSGEEELDTREWV